MRTGGQVAAPLGMARAPSPDVRLGPRGLGSLGFRRCFAIPAALVGIRRLSGPGPPLAASPGARVFNPRCHCARSYGSRNRVSDAGRRSGCCTARDGPRPVAGRSPRPSWPRLTRMPTALRHPGCACRHTPALRAWATPRCVTRSAGFQPAMPLRSVLRKPQSRERCGRAGSSPTRWVAWNAGSPALRSCPGKPTGRGKPPLPPAGVVDASRVSPALRQRRPAS